MRTAKLYYDKNLNKATVEAMGFIKTFDHVEIDGCNCETVIQERYPKMYIIVRYKHIQHIIKGQHKTAVKFEV